MLLCVNTNIINKIQMNFIKLSKNVITAIKNEK